VSSGQKRSGRVAYSALGGAALAVSPWVVLMFNAHSKFYFLSLVVGLLMFPGTWLAQHLSGLSIHTGLLLLGTFFNWILFTAIILFAWSFWRWMGLKRAKLI
jgi:hypothetical protein